MRVIESGAAQCPTVEFELNLGVDHLGATLKVKFQGCPSYVTILPAHGKKVQKLHHRAVSKQELPCKTQAFKADCGGWFGSPRCVPDGPPQELRTTVNHWQEEACDLVLKPVNSPSLRAGAGPVTGGSRSH